MTALESSTSLDAEPSGMHVALIYHGIDEYVDAVSAHVREGLADGDRVLVVTSTPKKTRLQEALGPDADRVEFADSEEAYRPQLRATRAILNFVAAGGDRRTRIVAEQNLGRRNQIERFDYQRMEAAANVVYRDQPVSVLCPYDASSLGDALIRSCRETHPQLLVDQRLEPNPAYVEPRRYIADSVGIGEPPADAESVACEESAALVSARRFVREQAEAAGLPEATIIDLVLAVNEAVTNALTHGLPPRRIACYVEGRALICQVHDAGTGLEDPLAGFSPHGDDVGTTGHGLWLARQLVDSVQVTSGPTGTRVCLVDLLS